MLLHQRIRRSHDGVYEQWYMFTEGFVQTKESPNQFNNWGGQNVKVLARQHRAGVTCPCSAGGPCCYTVLLKHFPLRRQPHVPIARNADTKRQAQNEQIQALSLRIGTTQASQSKCDLSLRAEVGALFPHFWCSIYVLAGYSSPSITPWSSVRHAPSSPLLCARLTLSGRSSAEVPPRA